MVNTSVCHAGGLILETDSSLAAKWRRLITISIIIIIFSAEFIASIILVSRDYYITGIGPSMIVNYSSARGAFSQQELPDRHSASGIRLGHLGGLGLHFIWPNVPGFVSGGHDYP